MSALLKRALADSLRQFSGMKPRDLVAARHTRLMAYGRFKITTEEG
jgi:acetyl-CoA carboxylase carboxyl transferase subunit alpha